MQELGLRIPQDLSIGGYDGVDMLQKLHPRLTTIRQDAGEIGRKAAQLLMERIEKPQIAGSATETIACTLLPGESIGLAPKN